MARQTFLGGLISRDGRSIDLKLGAYYFKLHWECGPISGGIFHRGAPLSVEFYGYVTKNNYRFQEIIFDEELSFNKISKQKYYYF